MKQINSSSPHAIIMVGIPGAGKTFFADNFAKSFLVPILDQSIIRNHTDSKKDSELLTSTFLGELLKTKRTLIINAESSLAKQRTALASKVRGAGYEPLFIWVQTATPDAEKRSLKDGMSRDDFQAAVQAFQLPITKEATLVISGKHTHASQLRVVLKYLSEHKGSGSEPPTDRGRYARSIIMR
jgi:predicted kinase